jgi:uncharacterized protein YndB with AHSA1/START domain
MTVRINAQLDCPTHKVWDLISDFAGLTRWHPLLVSCDTRGSGIGSVRRADFGSWWAEEELTGFDAANHRLDYVVTASSRPEIVGAAASMELTATTDGGTQLVWISGHPEDHPHAQAVNPGLEAYYPVRIGHLRTALGQQD